MPAWTQTPRPCSSRMLASRSRARFWRFLASASASLLGDSIPTNATFSPAAAQSATTSGSRTMSIESCVEKITGSVRSRFQSRSALRDLGRLLAVDGEVVVGEEDGAVPVAVERIRLRENLRDRLVANAAAQIHDDVAELALERATATRLDDTDRVPVVAQQVDARRRRKGEVDL